MLTIAPKKHQSYVTSNSIIRQFFVVWWRGSNLFSSDSSKYKEKLFFIVELCRFRFPQIEEFFKYTNRHYFNLSNKILFNLQAETWDRPAFKIEAIAILLDDKNYDWINNKRTSLNNRQLKISRHGFRRTSKPIC